MKQSMFVALCASIVSLAGCTVVPDSIVAQPINVRTQQQLLRPPASNGTIFQSASFRPMFEDNRARLVGDILTIAIAERTSATKNSADSTIKTGGVAYAAPKILGVPATTTADFGLTTSSSNKFDEKGAASTGNTFTGTITVTVIDVLPNGYLLVSGEKQVALDKGVEYIRFSGIVNPVSVSSANIVPSTQVADARVEYRTNTRLDASMVMSQMAKFFLSVMPL